jgi:8-oxo-dGTP diphosphatase
LCSLLIVTAMERKHAAVRVTADLVILTVRREQLHVLLVERGNDPFRGSPALPGGFLRPDETLEDAARRELTEETNMASERLHLEQLRVYSDPDRDPRGRVITVAFLAIAPSLPVPVAGSDASAARWERVDVVTGLAFDHDRILADAVERARQHLENTTLATAFCADAFTIGELRNIYEVVWGVPVDPRNFNRKVTGTEGFVVSTGEKRSQETGRPAVLYRRGPATVLYPPMLRANFLRR